MDSAAFATWLAGIQRLSPSQRGRLLQELALAEANDPNALQERETIIAQPSSEAEAAPPIVCEQIVKAASGQDDLLSQIGRERLASFGCPHCDGDDIRPWG